MSEEARQAKREYERKWRAENQERVKAIRARYWERQAEKARCQEHAEVTGTE